MEKIYTITNVKIVNDNLVLVIDNQEYTFSFASFSDKLSRSTEKEKNDFIISPSGYGIHWRLIDEDISINGLLDSIR